ncbi:MAG: selenocysteine-specific translation elongation factor [Planctomycetaceae bacterium]
MSSSSETAPVTVGTAGHIDHGKTLLVERLTGMRADRPHEQARGMTIDIGYAEMRAPDGRRIGFVDLPGHERFIRNMVAGATGIDLALLVVAADDGVMPQTREHVEILGLLGIRDGIVVLNKVDLVDEETRLLAIEELRDFLQGSSLADAPILPVSAATGEGIDALRAAILERIAAVSARQEGGCFYLPVQRTFAAAGFGCIVTGVPSSGSVRVGDELELLPAGTRARVRAVEIYHEAAEEARAGHRTALNLAGIRHDEAGRGMAVASPGFFAPSRHVAVQLRLLPSIRKPLKHATRVRFLTGTLEEMAAVYLAEGAALEPGPASLAEIRALVPVVARDGDAFILRAENSTETLGGGRIVRTLAGPLGRKDPALLAQLQRWARALDDPWERLRAAIAESPGALPGELATRCLLAPEAAERLLEELRAAREVTFLAGGGVAPESSVQAATAAAREALEALHRENPLLGMQPLASLRDRAGLSDAMLAAALERMDSHVVVAAREVRLAAHAVRVDAGLSRAARSILESLRVGRFAPPEPEALPEATGLSPQEVQGALTLLLDRGAVRRIDPGHLYPKETLDEGIRLLHSVVQKRGSFEPLEAKTVFGGISRKWLIPLLEHYDRIGATRRDGNSRIVTRRGEAMAQGGVDAK